MKKTDTYNRGKKKTVQFLGFWWYDGTKENQKKNKAQGVGSKRADVI